MGDTPLVMNQTRGALCGGKWGDLGRGALDDDGTLLISALTKKDISWRYRL
jgi:hypothetical protein